jgi:hypothetical protein
MSIDIYRANGKFTFTPGAGTLHASIELAAPHNVDFDRNLLIVPSVHAPEFTPGEALLSAHSRYFGMRITQSNMNIEAHDPTPEPRKKGRKRK